MIINGIGVAPANLEIEGVVRVGGDVRGAYDNEVMTALANTQDLIGAVLRIHFCLEEFLNIWCNKISGDADFFDIGFIGFDKKSKIAQKLGLPANVIEVFLQFNKLRNKYAHDTSANITIQKLDEIRVKIDNLPCYGEVEIPKINDPKFETYAGSKIISWDGDNITIKDKLVLLYFVLSIKIIGIYVVELKKRNISFEYAA
ncbi:hypothetical protein [Acinetobacter guillouiae]|uniref:hypothetical protein n=1 Tax=Acinetobacter guillouiae TaxID=106649 RepID=UPI00333F4832